MPNNLIVVVVDLIVRTYPFCGAVYSGATYPFDVSEKSIPPCRMISRR